MADDKPKPRNHAEEQGGQRPSQSDIAKALSGTRPAQMQAQKGHRPGQRPTQVEPSASLGPIGDKPGSAVPPKK